MTFQLPSRRSAVSPPSKLRLALATALIGPAAGDRRSLAAAKFRINELLETNSMQTALQPVVDVATDRLIGMEALTRFPDGRSPDAWFAEAGEIGLGIALDRMAFHTALNALGALPSNCYLSLNATPDLLTSPGFASGATFGRLPLDRLVIEITEHARIADYTELHSLLVPLREHGLRLAVDDTGAGYASFAHVLQLRPDIIKVDRSLITNITEDGARRALITSLVLLALELDAVVVAEGVQTTDQIDALANLGVDHVQGYLLARPSTDPDVWRQWATRRWRAPDEIRLPTDAVPAPSAISD